MQEIKVDKVFSKVKLLLDKRLKPGVKDTAPKELSA
jgi:hypothetical protein